MSRRDVAWPYLITVLAVASVPFALLDLPNPPRAAVLLSFVLVCPGMALVRLLRLREPLTEFVLAIVVSLALAAVVATVPMYLGAWNPDLSLLVIAEVSLAAVLADLVRAKQSRDPSWTLRSRPQGDPRLVGFSSFANTVPHAGPGDRPARPISVLMVTPRFPPFVGGVETHVYEVSRRLVRMGVDVTVVTTDPTGALPLREDVAGIKVHRVAAWPARSDLYFAPAIASWVQRGSWSLVHLQGYHTLVAPIALVAASVRHVPYVVTFHSGGHSSTLRNAIRPAQTALLGPFLRRAWRLIAVSTFESELFQARLGLPTDRFAVVPNGADLPPGAPRSPGSPRGDVILSVGRLERYKGHHRLIAALPIVAKEIPAVRLVVVGSGPYQDALQRAAEQAGVADRVEIRSIPNERRAELSALLNSAGLVALLSEYESQGISVMEALAMGAPVLASDSTALGELGARGLVDTVPLTASHMAVAEAIIRGLRATPARLTTPLPTWDDTADALRSIYAKVVEGQGPQDSTRTTLSVKDLAIAALPLLAGLVLLFFGVGSGVTDLGS